MKIQAAIDYPSIEQDKAGMYVWLNPNEESTIRLLRMLRSAPFKTYDGTELHCTVMHSKALPAQATPPEDKACMAVLEAFITWQDHKDRTIVVAALSSPDIEGLHADLAGQGFVHSHHEFNPHITVGKDVDLEPLTRLWLTKVNEWLESNEVIIYFSPQLRATPLA